MLFSTASNYGILTFGEDYSFRKEEFERKF
jgi:hypothetical protein